MRKNGQSTLEYAVLIGVVVAALVAMQGYLRRGVQGRIKAQADKLGEGGFYSPGATNSNYKSTKEISGYVSIHKPSATIKEIKVDPSGKTKKIIWESNIDESTEVKEESQRTENILPLGEEPQR